jgi:hypothetical protein
MDSTLPENIKIDIIDYLGKYEGGVLALITIGLNEKYHEAVFYYTDSITLLTPDIALENELGCVIEKWEEYDKVIYYLIQNVVPCSEIMNMIDDFEPSKYGLYLDTSGMVDKNSTNDSTKEQPPPLPTL